MSLKTIRLVGAARYNYRGELFLEDKAYKVSDAKATNLLRSKDDWGRFYFKEVVDMSIVKEPEPEATVPEEEKIELVESTSTLDEVTTVPEGEGDAETEVVGDIDPNLTVDQQFDDSDLEEV